MIEESESTDSMDVGQVSVSIADCGKGLPAPRECALSRALTVVFSHGLRRTCRLFITMWQIREDYILRLVHIAMVDHMSHSVEHD